MTPPRPIETAKEEAAPAAPNAVAYLMRYIRPTAPLIVLGVGVAILGRALVLTTPNLARSIIDLTMLDDGGEAVGRAALLFLGAVIGVAVLQFCSGMIFAVVGERVVLHLRSEIFRHVMGLSMDFFERRRVGEILSRIATDATVVREIGTALPLNVVTHTATIVGVLAIVLIQYARLGLALIAFVPLVAVVGIVMGRLVRSRATTHQDNLATANVSAEEALSGVATVKSFGQEDGEQLRYEGRLRESFRSSVRVAQAREGMRLLTSLAIYGGLSTVLWYATTLIGAGRMTTGDAIAFILYALIAGNSFGTLAGVWTNWERMRGVSQRLVEVFHELPTVVDRPDAKPFDGQHSEIAFKDVRFAYPTDPDTQVLHGLDFSVRFGEQIALVGESGAGKSTVAALLLRLYDVTGGGIEIDGVDLRELARDDLVDAIAVVPQDVLVFGRTVRENVLYGQPEATDDEIWDALQTANAADFVRALPGELDEVLGERGVTLSGGQRQRLAIARAVLKDPAILILDEATSALDTPNERAVRDALQALMVERTTLVIAHRLATIEGADRVLVLHEGRLVESGAHGDLLDADGHYARLYRMGRWDEGQVA